MTKSLTGLVRLTWWTGHVAPLLATVSAVVNLGGLLWQRLNHPSLGGATGAASAAVWWADYALRNRAAREQAARQAQLERTPPLLEFLDAKLRGDQLVVAIRSINLVPLTCRWVVVTTANAIVGSIMTQDVEVFPAALFENVLVLSYDIQRAKVSENYLELRFRYTSLYSAKLGNPADLGLRTLVVAWHLNGELLERRDPLTPRADV